VCQLIGIFLVKRGQYRRGAIFQIIASIPCVPAGIVGLIGARKAWRYPAMKAWADALSEQSEQQE